LEFASLRGRRIESWVGVEMALRADVAGAGPQFDDAQVSCLQLFDLQAALDDGGTLSVGTYQDDAVFGLWPRLEVTFDDDGHWEGIYRSRPLIELPVGQVEQVAVFADEGVLAEVHLWIGARPLLLIAGELEEAFAGQLLFCRLDESVLAFTDPGVVDHVPWNSSRRGLARIRC
jgi:hypothetical protein